MTIDDVLNLIGGVVVEINRSNYLVSEYWFQDKFHHKEITISTFFKKVFLNYDNPDNQKIFKSLERWIIDTDASDNNTSVKYYASNGVERFISVVKKNKESSLLCYLSLSNDRKNYPLMDSLTGVYQKSGFEEIVNAKAQKHTKPFFMGIVDVDNFKTVNDSYGHMHGDNVLRKVASILTEAFPDGYVGRIGGDEFAFICESSTEYQNVWDRLHKAFDIINGERRVSSGFESTTFTIGVARYGIDGTTFEELFLKADRALYRGKRKGKNCFIIYLDELHNNIVVNNRTSIDTNKLEVDHMGFIAYLVKILASKDPNAFQQAVISVQEYFLVDYALVTLLENGKPQVKWLSSTTNMVFNQVNYDLYEPHITNGAVKITEVQDLVNENRELFDQLNQMNIKSFVRTELKFNNDCIGSFSIGTYKATRFWSIDEIELMKIIANIFSSFLN